MGYRIALVLLGSFTVHSLPAQTVTACAGQLVPLKPTSVMTCPTAAPVCLTDAYGLRGHWVWGCPAGTGPASFPNTGIDPGLLDAIAHPVVPHIMTPMEAAMEAARLRQLQLQNQINQERLRGLRLQNDSQFAVPPAPQCAAGEKSIFDGDNWVCVPDLLQATPAQARKPDIGTPLDNAQVAAMAKAGVNDDTILFIIDVRPAHYSLSEKDRADLRSAGVSETIIKAMADRSLAR